MSKTTLRTNKSAMKTHPEIPCESCGHPRTFHAGLQWCSNCGWNRQAALSGLRRRFQIMGGVAALIVIGEAFLLWLIPRMGIIYLPLAGLLAAAVTIIPYREYRVVQRASLMTDNYLSSEVVAHDLQRLKPHMRVFALLLLVFASVAAIGLLLSQGPWVYRILAGSVVLVVAVIMGSQLLMERRIAASCASTWGRIVGFERRGRRGGITIYEYDPPGGNLMTGKCGGLVAFSVGMTVPVLYNATRPEESLPVPAFIFHKIRLEQPA